MMVILMSVTLETTHVVHTGGLRRPLVKHMGTVCKVKGELKLCFRPSSRRSFA